MTASSCWTPARGFEGLEAQRERECSRNRPRRVMIARASRQKPRLAALLEGSAARICGRSWLAPGEGWRTSPGGGEPRQGVANLARGLANPRRGRGEIAAGAPLLRRQRLLLPTWWGSC